MATGFSFEQTVFNWDAQDAYQEFQRFKQHVQFTFKGPLAKADKPDRAGWLGMWIGQQGREVYKTFTWEAGEQDDPDAILTKLETYVKPAKNKRIARFKAQQRKQTEGEAFDNFVKDLRLLLLDCEYTNSDDVLIDLIINGVKHHKVQERLLDQGQELSLKKAIDIGRQYELSQAQMKVIRGEEVMSVKSKKLSRPKIQTKGKSASSNNKNNTQHVLPITCGRCGTKHEAGKCPAKGTVCRYCKKSDHWMKVCRKRLSKINMINKEISKSDDAHSQSEQSESEDDVLYIKKTEPVNTIDQNNDKWTTELTVNNTKLKFRLDTGAKCNIITKADFTKFNNVTLERAEKSLKSYSNHRINPLGSVKLTIKHKDVNMAANFEVVDLKQGNILSGDIAEKLNLLKRVDSIHLDTEHELTRDFPELVKTTGTLPGEYSIKIEENAQGVVHPPRKLPAAIKPKAIAKLQEMEEFGYLTQVKEPTEWVSSMVVSCKKEKIRICIDPKDLNKFIKREHYPMKTIDDIVTEIPNAKVFSVLDANPAFCKYG